MTDIGIVWSLGQRAWEQNPLQLKSLGMESTVKELGNRAHLLFPLAVWACHLFLLVTKPVPTTVYTLYLGLILVCALLNHFRSFQHTSVLRFGLVSVFLRGSEHLDHRTFSCRALRLPSVSMFSTLQALLSLTL
jgi:hypothetical protein